ncbi:hypothetical protein KCU78_g63, partial [Aureobasidium melanogenum]
MGNISFPVVCAASQSQDIMNRLLIDSDIDEEDTWDFVFVDSIDHCYNKPSAVPVKAPSNSDSPFISKTPHECAQLLLELRKDTDSEIIPHYSMIMDERSLQDDTVLLVTAGIDAPVYTVRATFGASAQAIVLYLAGHRGIEEDIESASQEDDGTLVLVQIIEHHGITLRWLSLSPLKDYTACNTQWSDHNLPSATILSAITCSCPLIEDSAITVRWSKGSSEEVRMYHALGSLSNLRNLSLTLDASTCSHPLVIRGFHQQYWSCNGPVARDGHPSLCNFPHYLLQWASKQVSTEKSKSGNDWRWVLHTVHGPSGEPRNCGL